MAIEMMSDCVPCPICGNEKLHMQFPFWKGKYEENGADYRLFIPFWCENGCRGNLIYHHHKGTTSLLKEELPRKEARHACT